MPTITPVPDEAAALVDIDQGDQGLVIADFHAGIEAAIRYEQGLALEDRAAERRERVLTLLDTHRVDRVIFLGDVTHSIGHPRRIEGDELEHLFAAIDRPITVVKGNHDGAIENWLSSVTDRVGPVTIVEAGGAVLGSIGFAHGHGWPIQAVLDADAICIAHEHPCVRLVDEVGGHRIEPVWLRGQLDLAAIDAHTTRARSDGGGPTVVVVPAFNRIVGGTWVNRTDTAFLSPLLEQGFVAIEAYLLDGTRLGRLEDL